MPQLAIGYACVGDEVSVMGVVFASGEFRVLIGLLLFSNRKSKPVRDSRDPVG